jgi:hypothetical protein
MSYMWRVRQIGMALVLKTRRIKPLRVRVSHSPLNWYVTNINVV